MRFLQVSFVDVSVVFCICSMHVVDMGGDGLKGLCHGTVEQYTESGYGNDPLL